MTPNSDDLITQNKLIREGMEIMGDGELLEICASRGSGDWTESACDIALAILRERGVDVRLELEALEANDDEESDEADDSLDLSRIDWQMDSADVIFYELCKRNLILDEMGNVFTDFFSTMEEGTDSPSELADEIKALTNEELLDAWLESDPLEWSREEMDDLRREFVKRGVLPMYMLDAPAMLVSKLPYLTEESLNLRGWPGYRFRPGRCGLDYMDMAAEEGHIIGMFIRALFTFKLRTTNLIYIRLMMFFAIPCLLPLLLFATSFSLVGFLFLPIIAVGFFLVINVAYSIQDVSNWEDYEGEEPPFWPPY